VLELLPVAVVSVSGSVLVLVAVISSNLELMRLNLGMEPRVVTAMTQLKQRLFQYAYFGRQACNGQS